MADMRYITEDVSSALATQLASLQGDRTDEQFATLLGISRVQWSHVRHGRRRPSYDLVKRAAALFPELYPIVMRDLIGDPPKAAV